MKIKKIKKEQFNFRKQRSSIVANSKMLTFSKDKRKRLPFFFDIEKAFNEINCWKMLEQLE